MTAYYNEIDPFCVEWLRNLILAGMIAPGDVDSRSIEDVHPNDLDGYTQHHFFAGLGAWSFALRLAGWSDHRPVWTGSCPCQPFSQAGKGKGFADERHLWPAWFHLIRERRPDVIFGEQVAGPDGRMWLDLVQTDLEADRYAFGPVGLSAAGVGAPHIRERLYWLGYTGLARSWRNTGTVSGAESRPQGGVWRIADKPELASLFGELADDYMQRRESIGLQLRERRPDAHLSETAGRSEAGFVGHDDDAGSQGRSQRRDGADQCSAGPASLAGFWAGADWIPCRDGKWRPVEPGTFPLVNGAPARVGRIRAYGNAIVAPLAAAFIESAAQLL